MLAQTENQFKIEFTAEETGGKTTAIIVAAGTASRMCGIDKIMLPVLNTPVIIRSILAFENCQEVDNIVVVLRKELVNAVQNLIEEHKISKVTDLVEGGSTRAESVSCGIAAIGMETDIVLIHDGARPLVTQDIIESVKNAAELYGGAAPAVPLKDTVKIIDSSGKILETPQRSTLAAVQTPQGFKMTIYKEALSKNKNENLTDDCQLLEKIGVSVYTVEGSYENIKITTPEDISVAEEILRKRGEKPCE